MVESINITNYIIEMIYYTTVEQENLLDTDFKKNLIAKRKEIKEQEKITKKICKYSERVYVTKPKRTFYVNNDKIYLVLNDIKMECPQINNTKTTEVTDSFKGGIYKLDPDFSDNIKNFISRNNEYYVTFNPDGKYGISIHYYAENNVIPAIIESITGETLIIEDETKYDIAFL